MGRLGIIIHIWIEPVTCFLYILSSRLEVVCLCYEWLSGAFSFAQVFDI
jgi:hypothetical protein